MARPTRRGSTVRFHRDIRVTIEHGHGNHLANQISSVGYWFAAEPGETVVGPLKRPRKIILMVRAGEAVDEFIEQLIPYLEAGDLIIDGGNSHFPDTIRRTKYLAAKGLL